MAKARNQWEAEAASMAQRIDEARAAGQQLGLFGDDAAEVEAKGGRGKGKALSSLREILARRGLRQPEDVLAHIAALDDPEGPVMAALKKAEAVALALYGHAQAPAKVKLDLFQQFYGHSLRALDALLPYGLAKVTPDAAPVQATQINVYAGQPAPQEDAAKAVSAPAAPLRLAPPPMPHEIKQNQSVTVSPGSHSDADTWTEGAKP